MVPCRHYPANYEVLVLCPIREGNDGRIPEDSVLGLEGLWRYLRDVTDNGRYPNMVRIAVGLDRALPKELQPRLIDRFLGGPRQVGLIAALVQVIVEST